MISKWHLFLPQPVSSGDQVLSGHNTVYAALPQHRNPNPANVENMVSS
jgi:hypothetical protein